MTSTLRLIVADLDGTRIGEWVPLTEVTYDNDRSRPGTFKATVEPRGTKPSHPVNLFVLADGVQHWAGTVWRIAPAPTAGEPWEVEASGFAGRWAYATNRVDKFYSQVDQASIASDLITTAGVTNWTMNFPLTGIKRDYTVEGAKAQDLLKSLTDLSDNLNGFDLFVDGDLSTFRPRVTMRYPRDHRNRWRLAVRPGVKINRWDEDWTYVANIITAAGDDNMVIHKSRPDVPGWPSMARQITYSGVKDPATLDSKATRFLDEHAEPLVSAEVEASTGDSYMTRIGDDVRLIDTDGHRDAIFQLVTVSATWVGSSRVEKLTLAQEEINA